MLSRSLRPLTTRAASLATTSLRPNLNTNVFRSSPCARTLSTTPQRAAASEPAAVASVGKVEAKSKADVPQQQLPYFVGRNNLNNLGVYHWRKRGGNLKLTLVKRGEGDLQALKRDIRDVLKVPDSDVSVNSVTRHIVIRGHWRNEVVNFLLASGF